MDQKALKRLPVDLKSFLQPFPRDGQFFDMDSSLTDNSHKICIAKPARQYMHVDVPGHSGPCAFPKIHSQVNPLRCVNRP